MPDDRDQPLGWYEQCTPVLRFEERVISVPMQDRRHDTYEMRTVKILQQRWEIYEGGLPAVTRSEWRDVPCVKAPDAEPS